MMAPEELFTSAEVCQIVGITYRKLDYWIRSGAVFVPGEGSGSPRRFGRDDLFDVALLAEIVRWTNSVHQAAAIVAGLDPQCFLGAGSITLTVRSATALVLHVDELLDRLETALAECGLPPLAESEAAAA